MRSKKAIYNIISNLFLQFITIIYGFVVPKIIISSYGSNVNGLVTSITQFLAYISLLDSGFTAVIKSELYKPIATKNKKSIESILKASKRFFKKIAIIFIFYLIILAIIFPLFVNNNFDYWFTFGLIIILSISTFAEYYFGVNYKIYLHANQKNYIISTIQSIVYILTIIITIILSKINASIIVLKAITVFIFILRPIIQNIYVKKKYNINIKDGDDNFKLKNKWDGLAQHIAAVIHNNTDITLLTFFCSLSEVSVYSVYYLVVAGVKKIITSFTGGIDASFGDMIAKKEIKNLNKKFGMYETFYLTLTTIVFSITMVLIIPFISIYTKGITDANYMRPLFGYLIVLSEYLWAIRLPYSSLVLASGHFKETRIGAWIECISNLVISLILVFKFGIIGVAIGTIVAMSIRTIEFIYHTNKHILLRNISISIKKIILIIIETILVVIITKNITLNEYTNYMIWIQNAIIIASISLIIVIPINYLFLKNDYREFKNTLLQIFKRKKKC